MELLDCPYCDDSHLAGAERCSVTLKVLPRIEQPPPPPPAVRLALRVAGGRVLRLHVGTLVVLGRDPGSPIADLCRGNVSRKHAEVTARNERTIVLVDHGSLNRTRVNGKELEHGKERQLMRGDVVELAYDDPLAIEVVDDAGDVADPEHRASIAEPDDR